LSAIHWKLLHATLVHVTGRRRGLRQWLRDDLKKMVGVRGAVRLIRRDPRVLWWLALYLAVTNGVMVIGLALAGRLDLFSEWYIYPAIVSGSLFGRHLYELRESIRRDGDDDVSSSR
jgi:hypothetical protein